MNKIYDHQDGIFYPGYFEKVREKHDAQLGYFTIVDDPESPTCWPIDDKIAIVLYDDDNYFMANDWQGWQPDMMDDDDIAKTKWVYVNGCWENVIMLDGLPRIF